jgi:hypothetical protein
MNLPDINFWIAICSQSHLHHGSAKAWMQQAGRPTELLPFTQYKNVRVAILS